MAYKETAKTEQENTKQDTQEPITHIQELGIKTLLLLPSTRTTMQEAPNPEQTIPKIPFETQIPDTNKQARKTRWGILEYAKWNETKQVW